MCFYLKSLLTGHFYYWKQSDVPVVETKTKFQSQSIGKGMINSDNRISP